MGSGRPRPIPRSNENAPAASPLMATILFGSLSEMRPVKLLSNPQARHAPNTRMAPSETSHPAEGLRERRAPPAATAAIAPHVLRPTDSRKRANATRPVATTSKLSNSEVVAAGVRWSPRRSRIGPAIPPERIAPRSHGTSRFSRRASRSLYPNAFLRSSSSPKDAPAPR